MWGTAGLTLMPHPVLPAALSSPTSVCLSVFLKWANTTAEVPAPSPALLLLSPSALRKTNYHGKSIQVILDFSPFSADHEAAPKIPRGVSNLCIPPHLHPLLEFPGSLPLVIAVPYVVSLSSLWPLSKQQPRDIMDHSLDMAHIPQSIGFSTKPHLTLL